MSRLRASKRHLRAIIASLCACCCSLPSGFARAELSARGVLAAGAMSSDDQRDVFGFSRAAVVSSLHLELRCLRWLRARTGLFYDTFWAHSPLKAGGVLAPSLGLEGHFSIARMRPYMAPDVAVAFTGQRVRPMLSVALGVDFDVHTRVSLGPVVGYGQVFERNRPGLSHDAVFLWVGLAIHLRPPPAQPARVRVRRNAPGRVRLPAAPALEPVPARAEEPTGELMALIEHALPTQKQQVELLAPVLFEYDMDALSPVGIAMLHEVAHTLAIRPDLTRVGIVGYADARGSQPYNQALSLRRAERVRAWLVAHGIAAERLEVDARGADEPVERGANDAAHTQNRRVVFRVLETEAPR